MVAFGLFGVHRWLDVHTGVYSWVQVSTFATCVKVNTGQYRGGNGCTGRIQVRTGVLAHLSVLFELHCGMKMMNLLHLMAKNRNSIYIIWNLSKWIKVFCNFRKKLSVYTVKIFLELQSKLFVVLTPLDCKVGEAWDRERAGMWLVGRWAQRAVVWSWLVDADVRVISRIFTIRTMAGEKKQVSFIFLISSWLLPSKIIPRVSMFRPKWHHFLYLSCTCQDLKLNPSTSSSSNQHQ